MIRRDGSAANFELKRRVFDRCSLHIATPSRWLMGRVDRALIAPAIASSRVIPNGVDLTVFSPGNQRSARDRLNLAQDLRIILCVGNTVRNNVWRDFETALAASRAAVEGQPDRAVLIAVGDTHESSRTVGDHFEVSCRPHVSDSAELALYYQAADILLHSSKADTFPTVVLEAMACGTAVVATAVGGIPEQVVDRETGYLVTAGDVRGMTRAIGHLLDDPAVRRRFGAFGATTARARFDQSLMVDRYLDWYGELASATRPKP
jgi:glycosyltransferase involved in cell wall biosynthesis